MKTIRFRSLVFNTDELPEGRFRGEDVAAWLAGRLTGWKAEAAEEDWGWSVYAKKSGYSYLFGVYDYDLNDRTEEGPLWRISIYNRKDWASLLKGVLKYRAPIPHSEVVSEIENILRSNRDLVAIEQEEI